jgi:GNAT superfamily N-acetyltransferase
LGRALVAAAESELAARGCGLLEITSNSKRTDAHAFYESLGYERTSVRLAKTIGSVA